ncbi:protein phosphatase 2C domain-containing protein [Streptomyces virens]|uniref:Integrase n=2 Tax=Streptomyces TaxID=1883 RepID=A0AA40S9B4_9ACTN|nr:MULTISPECIES: hypothetical protein [Streptomyces]MBA8942237.1 hypothetical protein [Streptomyces calvus]MBA8975826.1 hypothetical protein [Streptomyces calvus]MYS30292.1 hypothetical protein [Streptomyces sp. SID7804]GGP51760.1 hypothetical protein GCM10010247_25480 [Streptomyces calvus]
MHVSFASVAGSAHKPNEDFLAVSPRVALVLDGLTSPPELGSGCIHGTPWFVSRLGTQLLREATCRPEAPLADCVAEAITRVADLHRDTCDLSHLGTPSCSVALVREGADTVDHLSIFDSVILLDGPRGLKVFSDLRVDGYAQQEHKETTRHRIGTPEHQQAVSRLVAAQRPHRNVPDGYWVAAANPAAATNAVTGSVPRAEVTRAAVLSDGASCLAEDYRLTDWAGLLDLLEADGPDELISRVRQAESTDPSGERWPRYKASDDSTAVFCRFDSTGSAGG